MVVELGHLSLWMALILACLQTVVPGLGIQRGVPLWVAAARPAAVAHVVFLFVAFDCLVASFLTQDFSVVYVALNSDTALPWYYRITATWGSHEGSMLLWALILGFWTLAVSMSNNRLHDEDSLGRVLVIMGTISVGILAFILLTSNPFERQVPAPTEGNDLNPLLQDIGMILHPPMLYMGYVGLSVAFSLAIAALWRGSLDAAWIRWLRPWTLTAWGFLTLGIVLGSWWAYYEFGWGGWWFWDPVENASFMPWLVATALIHSLAATEKRGAFKAWTVLLAIFAFSLSLLGTFLVRSGVLTSVHAFASDPTRGLFILVLLGIVVGGSLILYAIRAPVLQDATVYALFSKENLLLVNNLLLVTASASILLGTLYPLILDALNLGKISVGPPYFASQFTPLMVPVFLIAGWAPSVAWRQGDAAKIARMFRFLLPLSIAAAAVINALTWSPVDITAMTGMSLGIWLLATSLTTFWSRARLRETLILGLRSQSRSTYGMTVAHLGLAVFLFGVVVSNRFSEEKTVRFAPGQTVTLAQYRFTFKGTESLEGPNYLAEEGHFSVSVEGGPPLQLRPQKRTYNSQGRTMTEAAIDPGLFRDLYIALGEPMDHGAWSVRLHYKPLIRWVWLGGLLMMTGGLLSASDRRYRLAATRRVALTLDTRGILTGSDSPCATSCRSPSSAS